MSYPSWYPSSKQEKWNFFLKTFPVFILLLFFFFFGLDWLGAFEFLEVLVRDNSAWLLKVIWDYDTYTTGWFERVDIDPLTNGLIFFGEPYFPGIQLDTYPRVLLIIRACTGMEAGALMMALIFITPAKWYNKLIAHVVNLLMMHIGNTFRVAFHFWYTQHLFQKFHDADKAFFYAHDMLSKVFGFVGIVIFTLVIERTGVNIVSTFSAWIDALGEGIKKLTNRIEKNAYYDISNISYEKPTNKEEQIPLRIEQFERRNFYPNELIAKNKWSFFNNTFSLFTAISLGILLLGLIPYVNQIIGYISDLIAVNAFDADLVNAGTYNAMWWKSNYDNISTQNFIINIASSGILLTAILIAGVIVTPGIRKNKIIATSITPFIIMPLNILRLGFQKWATWAVGNNNTLKASRPLLYLNLADMITTWFPFIFWCMIFILLLFIYKKLNVKVFNTFWAWLHQLVFTLGWILGLKKKPV